MPGVVPSHLHVRFGLKVHRAIGSPVSWLRQGSLLSGVSHLRRWFAFAASRAG